MIIASGVSSTTRSTPRACSIARMLRPCRPMMRPFISSDGRSTLLTAYSATWSLATRSIAKVTISRARRSASSAASASTSRMVRAISWRAPFSTSASSTCRPSSTLICATLCNSVIHSCSIVSSLAERCSILVSRWFSLRSRLSICSKRRSALSNRLCNRSSIRSNSLRRRVCSASISLRRCTSSSLIDSCCRLASVSASAIMRAACSSALLSKAVWRACSTCVPAWRPRV